MTDKQAAIDWIDKKIAEAKNLGIPRVEIYETIRQLLTAPVVDVEFVKRELEKWTKERFKDGYTVEELIKATCEFAARGPIGNAPVVDGWKPIETAPRDGTWFLALIEGIPYKAKAFMNGDVVNYHWCMHTNVAQGQTLRIERDENGEERRVQIKEADEPKYEAATLAYKLGMNHIPTNWIPLPIPQPPKDTK